MKLRAWGQVQATLGLVAQSHSAPSAYRSLSKTQQADSHDHTSNSALRLPNSFASYGRDRFCSSALLGGLRDCNPALVLLTTPASNYAN